MYLPELLKSTSKNHRKIRVKGISFDSRKVKKDYIFLQLKEIKYQEQNLFKMQF